MALLKRVDKLKTIACGAKAHSTTPTSRPGATSLARSSEHSGQAASFGHIRKALNAALVLAVAAPLAGCGGGDSVDIATGEEFAAPAGLAETVAEARMQPLSVTPSTANGGTTSLSINSSANYVFAKEAPTANSAGQVAFVAKIK